MPKSPARYPYTSSPAQPDSDGIRRGDDALTECLDVTLTVRDAPPPRPAPAGGVLPPVDDIMRTGQSLGQQGDIPPGTTTQSVIDVPDGSYGREGTDPAMWVSEYPGIDQYLVQFPMTAYTVRQASTVVTVPDVAAAPAPAAADIVPGLRDLGTLFGS